MSKMNVGKLNISSVKIRTEENDFDYFSDAMEHIIHGLNFFLQNDSFLNELASHFIGSLEFKPLSLIFLIN